jgi:hypothetical protein
VRTHGYGGSGMTIQRTSCDLCDKKFMSLDDCLAHRLGKLAELRCQTTEQMEETFRQTASGAWRLK